MSNKIPQVRLLVSEWCASCHGAERVWREISEERIIDFQVVDMSQPEGRALATRLRLKTIPSLVIDDELRAVGVQTHAEALAFIAGADRRAPTAAHQVGLGFNTASRVAVLSSAGYLLLGGITLPLHGRLFPDVYRWLAPLHVFTLGFLVFMIYGLADHMLPRFTGNPIRQGRWVWSQLLLAHLGLWALVAGLWFGIHSLAIAGGTAAWLGLLLFTIRLWPVLWPVRPGSPE